MLQPATGEGSDWVCVFKVHASREDGHRFLDGLLGLRASDDFGRSMLCRNERFVLPGTEVFPAVSQAGVDYDDNCDPSFASRALSSY